MDLITVAAFEEASPTGGVLVNMALPGRTVRWTDRGFVVWDGDTYAVEDEYGTLSSVEAIEDGQIDGATVCALTVLPADFDALAALSDPDAQGSIVTVHLAAVDRATGLLIGEPELLFRGEIDQPRLGVGSELTLHLDLITQEARLLEPNEQRRLTDSHHRLAWPDENGFENVVAVKKPIFWRQDDPRNAVG